MWLGLLALWKDGELLVGGISSSTMGSATVDSPRSTATTSGFHLHPEPLQRGTGILPC